MTLIIKIAIYIVFIVLILLIPSKWIKKLLVLSFQCKDKINDMFLKSMWGNIKRGRALQREMSFLETKITIGKISLDQKMSNYKFYTELLIKLIDLSRQKGIMLKKYLPEIKKYLSEDIKFEKKIIEELQNGYLQFFIVMMTTWAFVYTSQIIMPLNVSTSIYIVMFFIQLSGFFIFKVVSSKLKSRFFKIYESCFQELYVFFSLLEVGRPLNLCLSESKLSTGIFSTHAEFKEDYLSFQMIIDRIKQNGVYQKEDSQMILDSLWQNQELKFIKFHKYLALVKFLHLVFIYLPCYFLYLLSLFKFFMEQ
jgi:hypothetical protein